MEREYWVEIAEFEHYMVSNKGQVFNKKTNNYLKAFVNEYGKGSYTLVNPKGFQQRKCVTVASLVREYFNIELFEKKIAVKNKYTKMGDIILPDLVDLKPENRLHILMLHRHHVRSEEIAKDYKTNVDYIEKIIKERP